MAVNDLTVAPVATAFLGQFLSTDYFAASRDLLLASAIGAAAAPDRSDRTGVKWNCCNLK